MSEVMAIGDRTNNAQMIADCHQLGYIAGAVLDMTYGKGRFWKVVGDMGGKLHTNDIDPASKAEWHYNFTALPGFFREEFDTVVFDPPYKLNGTGGSHPSDEGYGVADQTYTKDRMMLVFDGIAEAVRVCKPNGHIIVKCQDQVVSGRKFWQTHTIQTFGETLGLRLVDMLHVRSYRPQPPGRRQVHSRQDYSTALIFQKGRS